ncbi:hypothetical protein [Cohnella herbarum]|nr:hypothetical protein [Cohnella herbarum]
MTGARCFTQGGDAYGTMSHLEETGKTAMLVAIDKAIELAWTLL